MESFEPILSTLPEPQLRLWPELDATPDSFTLYGGTALALRFGHRISVDFDFFSSEPFDPDHLLRAVGYLSGAEIVQREANTLTCRVDRGGGILVSYFGGISLKTIAPVQRAQGRRLKVASLLDLAGTKMDVVQKRAETKDYLDINALLCHEITLSQALCAAQMIYGSTFNPLVTLKALSFFDDIEGLPHEARQRIVAAVGSIDLVKEGLG